MRTLLCLFIIAAVATTGCQSAKKKKDKKEPEKRTTAELRDETSSDIEFQAFVGRLRKAVEARDANTLAQMMTQDFGYVMGATPDLDRKGEGVFQYWEENGLWIELEGILSEKFVKKGAYMVAPPQFADETLTYNGYRVGIRKVGTAWKFVYFVNG